MKVKLTDDALVKAAKSVQKSMYDSLPAAQSCEYNGSQEFERKMKKLIARTKKKDLLYTYGKRVAVIAVTVLASFSVWMSVDVNARAALLAWFMEIGSTETTFHFTNEETDAELSYTLTWVPDGYVETDINTLTNGVNKEFSNRADGRVTLLFTCLLVADIDYIAYLAPEMVWEPVSINGHIGQYYKSVDESETSELIWFDEDTGVCFMISAFLSREDMIRIAESVEHDF